MPLETPVRRGLIGSLIIGVRELTKRVSSDDPASINGVEETLSEYLCDWTDCPNVAVELLGVVRDLRLTAVVCAEHAALLASRANNDLDR